VVAPAVAVWAVTGARSFAEGACQSFIIQAILDSEVSDTPAFISSSAGER
jgi:hypothetical protein